MRYNKRIICIGKDPISANLAKGCGAEIFDKEQVDLTSIKKDIIIRGNLGPPYLRKLMANKKGFKSFYYIDTGYLDLFTKYKRKIWHRIIKNNFHVSEVLKRKGDRLSRLDLQRFDWKKGGQNIVVCPISNWSAELYGINPDDWLNKTIKSIRSYSDRPIIIRQKPRIRKDRMKNNSFISFLKKSNVFCVVTYNSISAVESAYFGIPAVTLGENAASPVCISDLSKIESPIYPDREMWLRNLAYSQFTCEEMLNGTAFNILNGR